MLDHARRFLAMAVPPPAPGEYLNIHWSQPKQDDPTQKWWDGRACETVDEAIGVIAWVLRAMKQADLYVCMSTQGRYEPKTFKKSGKPYKKAIRYQADVKAIRSLYIDVDVKADKGYASKEDAFAAIQQFIRDVGLPAPSAVVFSGGGYHLHWVLEHAITRDEWQPLANALSAATQHHGLKTDTQCTVDSARILRLPETFNYKSETPRGTELLSLGDPVTIEVMQGALEPYRSMVVHHATSASRVFEDGSEVRRSDGQANDDLTAGVVNSSTAVPADLVAEKCGFIDRSIKTGGKDNPNPLWFMTAALATFMENGRTVLHAMSDKHPGYDPVATDNLYDRVVAKQKERDTGWPRCDKISGYGAPECKTCPLFREGKSPLNFATPPAVVNGVSMAPTPMLLPPRYTKVAGDMIHVQFIDDSGAQQTMPIFPYPIYSGWLSNDPWTLHFVTRTENGRKTSVDFPTEIIAAGKDTFAKYLGGRGIFANDGQYKVFKEFLVSWLQTLQEAKDSVISASPFGWSVVDGKVEGFAYGGRVWMKAGDRAAANPNPVLSYQYTPKGDPQPWKDAAKVVYDQGRPALDAILAMGFAGPLVRFTGHGGLILNAYSPESGIGKTTAMKVSQAIWGHPVLAMQALNDTPNSVLGKMGQIRSLPMYWDEIKSDQQIRAFCSMVFTMTGGREKTRMTQDAQLRMSGQWQTALVSASNESLVDGMAREAGSTTAGLHRMFEYVVPPGNSNPSDVGVVQRLIGKLEDNYGHAGLAYSKFLGANWQRVEAEIAATHDALLQEVTVRQEERMWVSTMSVLIKGAAYANELELTNINLDNLKAFLLGVFHKNRMEVSGSSSDLTSDTSAITVLGELLNSTRARYTILTNRVWVGQGKPPKNAITIVSDLTKLSELRIQIGVEDRIMRIASTFLTNWMGERGYSRHTWMKKMEEEFGLVKMNGMLGGGTSIIGAKEQLIQIDMNHPKLAQFLE